jgi:hypothetical protein
VVRTYRLRSVADLVSAEGEVDTIASDGESRRMSTASVPVLIEVALATFPYVTLKGLA